MYEEDVTAHGTDDAPEADLDRGLVAAFGSRGESLTFDGFGLVGDLEREHGFHSRVLLRDEEDESTPVLRPVSADPTPQPTRPRYRVLGEIARGGVGVVFKGHDADIGRDVAMKVLQERHAHNPTMVKRFVEEAQVAGQLQHPGILPVYEIGLQPDRRPFFTMKLVKGRTLAAHLSERTDPASDRPRLLNVFLQICQTMSYAHARGVIHRDLKPSNVMVGRFGEVQVLDWGLAKVLTRGGTSDEAQAQRVQAGETQIETVRSTEAGSQSLAGSVMGTPLYMPPEQARGEVDSVDEHADVFALGGILCEILTGAPPYTGKDLLVAASHARLEGAHERLDACGADETIVDLARARLAPAPRARPRNAAAVAEVVEQHIESVELRARESELALHRAQGQAISERRARRLTLALGTTIILAIATAAASFVWVERDRAERSAHASGAANEVMNNANLLLGRALSAAIGEDADWVALRGEGAQIARMLDAGQVDDITRGRAETFLAELKRADRDRRMIEAIEEAVILGATHPDKESWLHMSQQLEAAFMEFGVDVTQPPDAQTADRIRASDMSVQVTEGLELWIGTEGQLGEFDAQRYTPEELGEWIEVLYQADPDPFRTAQRGLYYALLWDFLESGPEGRGRRPEFLTRLEDLVRSPDFDQATPRSLSWLGLTILLAGDPETGLEVYQRAVIAHPGDFMLNFDYTIALGWTQRWEEAIGYYLRCLAIRPDVGGIWRGLGIAYRETGNLDGSLRALSQSIHVQGDYAPTYVDHGRTLAALGRLDEAIDSYRRAIDMSGDLAVAHCYLGRALQETGALHDALTALERGHELGSAQPQWQLPSGEWVDECRALIEDQGTDAHD